MKTPKLPDAETGLRLVWPLIPGIHAALEFGIGKAREYFPTGVAVDPWLSAHIARYQARAYLTDSGIVCAELALSGLAVTDNRRCVRIWKADEYGTTPSPGDSETRQAFYRQEQCFLPFPLEVLQPLAGPNFIVLWNTTAAYSVLLPLWLVCTLDGDNRRSSVQELWRIKIPHPATVAIADSEHVAEVEDDLEEIQRRKLDDAENDDPKEDR